MVTLWIRKNLGWSDYVTKGSLTQETDFNLDHRQRDEQIPKVLQQYDQKRLKIS